MTRRSVLVTGGTVRLGEAIAARLGAAGWQVLTSSHRHDAGADLVADLADPSGATRLYAGALRLLGGRPPDALVNNAALFVGDEATLRRVNVESPNRLTTLMATRETGVGVVVNVLDAAALCEADGDATPYLASKRELLAATRRFAALFAATLRVNGVAPGPVLAPVGVRAKAGEMLLDRRPSVADVADAVAYLLGAEAVTGTVLPVDAGQHLLRVG